MGDDFGVKLPPIGTNWMAGKATPANVLAPQIRNIPVAAPAEGRKDLDALLGTEYFKAVAKKGEATCEITIQTKYGQVKVKAQYRPEYSDIILTVSDTQTSGTTLRIDLNTQGQPINLASIDDSSKLFGGLLRDGGAKYLTKLFGPVDENLFSKRVMQLTNYEKVTKYLREASADNSRRISLAEPYNGPKGTFVAQNYFKVAPLNTPLATSGVNTCAALIIIDKKSGKHYLAHIDPSASVEQIQRSLGGIDLSSSEIYVMKGMTHSGTVQNIFTALMQKGVENRAKFVFFSGTGFPGITSYNGELYLDPPTGYFTEKSKDRI